MKRAALRLAIAVSLLATPLAQQASTRANRILHFASHGLISAHTPLASSLLLSVGERDDGYLRADEILGLTLNADLVVLSGCRPASAVCRATASSA
jgi:CHAT domain-containing protein